MKLDEAAAFFTIPQWVTRLTACETDDEVSLTDMFRLFQGREKTVLAVAEVHSKEDYINSTNIESSPYMSVPDMQGRLVVVIDQVFRRFLQDGRTETSRAKCQKNTLSISAFQNKKEGTGLIFLGFQAPRLFFQPSNLDQTGLAYPVCSLVPLQTPIQHQSKGVNT